MLEEMKLTLADHGGRLAENSEHLVNLTHHLNSGKSPPDKVGAAMPDGVHFPLRSDQDLADLDNKLQDEIVRNRMVRCLASVGGESINDLLRRVMKRVFSNPLALQYNFHGMKGKKRFRDLGLRAVLFESVRIAFPQATDIEMEKSVSSWLATARDRDGGRQMRRTQGLVSAAVSADLPIFYE